MSDVKDFINASGRDIRLSLLLDKIVRYPLSKRPDFIKSDMVTGDIYNKPKSHFLKYNPTAQCYQEFWFTCDLTDEEISELERIYEPLEQNFEISQMAEDIKSIKRILMFFFIIAILSLLFSGFTAFLQ